jgi:hypothetical protein
MTTEPNTPWIAGTTHTQRAFAAWKQAELFNNMVRLTRLLPFTAQDGKRGRAFKVAATQFALEGLLKDGGRAKFLGLEDGMETWLVQPSWVGGQIAG